MLKQTDLYTQWKHFSSWFAREKTAFNDDQAIGFINHRIKLEKWTPKRLEHMESDLIQKYDEKLWKMRNNLNKQVK